MYFRNGGRKQKMSVFALLSVIVFLLPGSSGAAPVQKRLVVHGEGSLMISPDGVRILVGVETLEPTLAQARTKNNQLFRNIMNQLFKTGIKNIMAKSDSIRVSLVHESSYPNYRLPKVIGYRIYNAVTIRIYEKDPVKLAKNASRILDRAIAAGANRVRGVEFLRMNAQWSYRKAMLLAIKDAKNNAVQMAAQASVTLGHVVSVTPQWGRYYPELRQSAYGSYHGRVAYTQSSQWSGGGGPVVAAGKFVVRAMVTMIYELK